MIDLNTAILFGLSAIALGLFLGLGDIASAIRRRQIEVNLKLPPIRVTLEDSPPAAQREAQQEKP